MNILSDHTATILVQERIHDLRREATHRRLVKIARGPQPTNVVLRIVKRLLGSRPQFQPGELSEEALYQAERLHVSPDEVQEQEIKRRLYERIARSNPQIDTENAAHSSWA